MLAALRTDALPLLAMTAKGYGESEPVADNDSEEGRAENRRIAFTLPALAAAQAGEEDGEADGESLVAQAQSGDPAEVCLARLDAILSENTIEFAPGSAVIAPESAPIVNAIAGVLRGCPDAALEVGGHTELVGVELGEPGAEPAARGGGAGGGEAERPAPSGTYGARVWRDPADRRQRHAGGAGAEPAHRLHRGRGGRGRGGRRWTGMS